MKMKNFQVTCILIFFISEVLARNAQNVLNECYCCGSINTLDRTAMSSKLCTDGRRFNLFCKDDSSIVEYSPDNYVYHDFRDEDWPTGRSFVYIYDNDNDTVDQLYYLPQ